MTKFWVREEKKKSYLVSSLLWFASKYCLIRKITVSLRFFLPLKRQCKSLILESMSQWTRGQGSHMVSDGRTSRPRGLGSTLASVGSSVTAAAQQSVEASHVCSNWRAYRCYSFVYLFFLFLLTRCSGFRTHCLWWKFQIVVLIVPEATNSSSG